MRTNNLKQGFGLFEMMIALGLIAGLGSMVVPNLFKDQAGKVRKDFLISFKTMLQQAVQYAVYENQTVQVYFTMEDRRVQLRTFDALSIEDNKHKKYKHLENVSFATELDFSESFAIKNFVINNTDEVKLRSRLDDVWFYIMPDGTSQPVTVNVLDQSDLEQQDKKFSFVVNPFYARVTSYEGFSQIAS